MPEPEMSISICMATYNGARFVGEQITSILEQLKQDDEVIVVDDCSKDDTVKILEDLNDPRIKIYLNDDNRSHVFSFDRAISLASNDIVFMSDQDDVWIEGRVSLMVKALLDTGAQLVSSNFEPIDRNGKKTSFPVDGVKFRDSRKHLKNIVDIFLGKTNYFGCAMAFRKDMSKIVVPVPSFVESHDLWVALAGNLIRSNVHLDERTLMKRVHDNNATETNRSLFMKIRARFIFAISIVVLLMRIIRVRNAIGRVTASRIDKA
jgi:glycosyltransferase involved in cell wall biosynthesis